MTRARRLLAPAVASVLALGALALTPSAAHAESVEAAAAPAPSLQWKVSQQFFARMPDRTFTGGASSDADGVVTFPDGVGTHDSGNGVTSIQYSGSVSGTFANAGTPCYTVTIADPQVTIDAQGHGQILATVSSDVFQQPVTCFTNTADSTAPQKVVVTTFDAATTDWASSPAGTSLTDTPDYAGVLPPGSEQAVALTGTQSRPTNGESFAPAFLAQLASGVRSHFYHSSDSAQPNKVPADFTAEAAVPTVTWTKGASNAITVSGSGFSRTTSQGDAGVYVGVAAGTTLPDVSSFDTSAFAGAAYVPSATIDATTGAFTTSVAIDPAQLDATKTYSIFTWRAHTHSTTSQDTSTPVTGLAFGGTTTIVDPPVAATGTAPVVTVDVAAPASGRTSLSYAPSATPNARTTISADVTDGRAVFTLPSTLDAGSYDLTAVSGHGATSWPSGDTSSLTVVTPASTSTSIGSVTTHSYGNAVRLTATVTADVAGTVAFSEGSTSYGTVAVEDGRAGLTLPTRLAVGRHTVKAVFTPASAAHAASEGTVVVTVKKVATSTAINVTKKPTTKATGTVNVRVRQSVGVSLPRGALTVRLTRGSVTKTVKKSFTNGYTTVTLPKVTSKGTWKISVSFAATALHGGSSRTSTFTAK